MHALAMEVIRSLSLIRQIILFVVGAPLVCRVADRWYVAGLVSWGVSKYRRLVARPVKFKVNFCRFIIRLWPEHSRCLHEYKNFFFECFNRFNNFIADVNYYLPWIQNLTRSP